MFDLGCFLLYNRGANFYRILFFAYGKEDFCKMLYDKDIREPLFDFLEESFGRVRILEEKNMGKSRADIVMITENAFFGVEIKSDADTYARLKRQVKDYDTFFDYNIIAVGSSHAHHIMEHVPEWWGIITIDEIDGKPDFYMYREAEPAPEVDIKQQLTFMWRPELADIQELNDMPKYKEKSKQFVIDKVYDKIPHDLLKNQMCAMLFERDYNSIAERINAYRIENGQKARRKRKYKKRKK